MRNNLKYEIAVGVVFVAAMAILGYYTIIMGKKYHDTAHVYNLTVSFQDVGGLALKDKVYVNGVHSGMVNHIELSSGKVQVVMEMFNTFELYENYSIKVRSSAALGGKQVSISPGFPADEKGEPYAVIRNYDDLQGELDDPFMMISQVLGDNRENVYQSIQNIRDITDKINRGQGTLGKLINEDSIHAGADGLVKDLREAVEDTREQAPITSFIRAALTIF